jgi:hypothetical protein
MAMRYIRNLSNSHVRVASDHTTSPPSPIQLEPRGQGQDVAELDEQLFYSTKVSRSVNVIVEEIDEEAYRARLDEIYAERSEKQKDPFEFTNDQGEPIPFTGIDRPRVIAAYQVDEEGKPVPAENIINRGDKTETKGKTLSELRQNAASRNITKVAPRSVQ